MTQLISDKQRNSSLAKKKSFIGSARGANRIEFSNTVKAD